MRKITQILTTAVLAVAFAGTGFFSSAANAAANCTDVIIDVSGNGSVVNVNCSTIDTITIDCVNNTTVANITYQQGQSGPATVVGNGSNGGAVSGTVNNSNGTTTQLGVQGCAGTPVASTTPSPTPSTTPSPTPGKGSVTPATLPNTASNSALAIVVGSLVAAAAIVAGSRLAVAAYRRISTK